MKGQGGRLSCLASLTYKVLALRFNLNSTKHEFKDWLKKQSVTIPHFQKEST